MLGEVLGMEKVNQTIITERTLTVIGDYGRIIYRTFRKWAQS